MRRALTGWLVAVVLFSTAGCKGKPAAPVPATPVQQAAAMELGFAAGSFMAQYTQPLEARTESAGKFARSEASLHTFMGRIPVNDADATSIVSAWLDGFDDPNPERGGPLLTQGVNDLLQRLSAGANPELFWVFKVGFTLAYEVESVNVLSQGSPQPEHVQPFAVRTARYRATLEADLEQAGLPQEVAEAAQGANIEIRSVSDLFAITRAGLKVKGLVNQYQ